MEAITSSQDYEEQLNSAAYRNAVDLVQTDTKRVLVLSFKALQLLRIKSLQQELFDLQMRIRLGGIRPEDYQAPLVHVDNRLLTYGNFSVILMIASADVAEATHWAIMSYSDKAT
jgi:hypothetical protein